jgi:WD40 repeat protein/serine/threonine protein kinase
VEKATKPSDAATLPPTPRPSPAAANQPTTPDFTAPPVRPLTGVVIPGYDILGELGRGGMGVVYKARHIKLQRTVALKMILTGPHASPEDLARFHREARAVAKLRHPNIVQLYEAGTHDDRPYFALEYVDGGSLADRMDGRPWPADRAAALVQTLARAMDHAHRQGIIHRDLKPANILLQMQNAECRMQNEKPGSGSAFSILHSAFPKITDFGLAKRLDGGDTAQTASGSIMGTPNYMAPEQAGGKREVGPACDVYALGAILYELLTGRPPFQAATPLDTVLQVLSEEPVPPSHLQGDVDRDLETICLKCLHKEPRQRYSSAAALANDLRRFRRGEPIRARKSRAWERLVKWARRKPAVAGLVGVSVLTFVGLLVGLVAVNLRLAQDSEETRAALEKLHRAHDDVKKNLAERNEALQNLQTMVRREQDLAGTIVAQAHRQWWLGQAAVADRLLEASKDSKRSCWEWGYLKRLCHAEAMLLRGHLGEVACVTFSPAGNRLASAGVDKTVKVWSTVTGRYLFTFRQHTARVNAVAFSPDGTRLASGGADGRVIVWDADSGKVQFTMAAHRTEIMALAISPNGARLASAARDHTVKLWDMATHRLLHELRGHKDQVFAVAFSPDSARLASAGRDRTIKLWDVATGTETDTLAGHTSEVTGLAFSPTGKLLASAGLEGALKVWDLGSRHVRLFIRDRAKAFSDLAWSRDGRFLASAGGNNTVKVWDAAGGRLVLTFHGYSAWVRTAAFSPDGRFLAAGAADGTIKVWDTTRDEHGLILTGGPAGYHNATFSPDGRFIAAPGPDETVRVWASGSGQAVSVPRRHLRGLTRVTYSPDGKYLAAGGRDGAAKVWEADADREILSFAGAGGTGRVAFSPDSRLLALAGPRRQVTLWNLNAGKEAFALPIRTGTVFALAFSPGGKSLATAGQDGAVHIWDAGEGTEARTLAGQHKGAVYAVAFSPHGELIASAGADGKLVVWDRAKDKPVCRLTGHTAAITAVAFSPDGRRVVTAGLDHNVRIWDVTTRREALVLYGHQAGVYSAEFSPDGLRIVSAGQDRTVRVWDATLNDRALADWEAQTLVDDRFKELLLRDDVKANLRADVKLTDEVRSTALALVEAYEESADDLSAAAWKVVRFRGGDAETYGRAVRWAEAAVRQQPGNGPYLNALGVALYRAKRFPQAVKILSQAEQINARTLGVGSVPSDLTFLAMAYHQGGQTEQAKRYLGRVREILKARRWRQDAQEKEFLREAEALLRRQPARNQPRPGG